MTASLPVLSRETVRLLDRLSIEKCGIPGVVLMENAGRGAAELLHALAPRAAVAIVCGKGNNAGDGFVIARHLANRGASVDVFLLSPSLSGDAAANLAPLRKMSRLKNSGIRLIPAARSSAPWANASRRARPQGGSRMAGG